MRIQFLEPARQELKEAISYYDRQREYLGQEFATGVKRALEKVLQYPEAWTLLSKRTRRCRIIKFPYAVIYQIRSDTILVVAIMHMHQKPNARETRLK